MLSEYTACAKTILLGEHFVVHGAPAVAAPLHGLQTTVRIYEVESLSSPEMQSDYDGETRVDSNELLGAALACFGLSPNCSWRFDVSSSIAVVVQTVANLFCGV
ncbi:MAG TPA: hypothetical protein EYN66_03970, partial [Myxococcales bacterium]|nr:hypothetical protein [Myxococcales bacterium]